MRSLLSLPTGGLRWLVIVAGLVFLTWLASGMILGFGDGLPLALHGLLLGGNLLLLALALGAQRREAAAQRQRPDQLQRVLAAVERGALENPPARPGSRRRRSKARSFIHDN